MKGTVLGFVDPTTPEAGAKLGLWNRLCSTTKTANFSKAFYCITLYVLDPEIPSAVH